MHCQYILEQNDNGTSESTNLCYYYNFLKIQMSQQAIVGEHTLENKPNGLNVLTMLCSPELLLCYWVKLLVHVEL